MESSLPRFAPIFEGARPEAGIRTVEFDSTALGEWDSSVLVFVLDAMRYCESHNLKCRVETLPDNIVGLITLSEAVPDAEVQLGGREKGLLHRLGAWGVKMLTESGEFLHFLGEFAQTVVDFLMRRVRLRWADFWRIFQASSSGALPIVTLISFLVGLILAFLGAVVLRRFGADYYVSYLVSYGVLRELGALMTAIIMAGRTGAAFAAELGTMKISQEINALETLGISPMAFLVLPRFLTIFVALPMLTIYANLIGVLGGMLVAFTMLDVTITQFITGLLEPVSLIDALLGLFKATVFGALIGLAGCMRGLQTGNDAGAVGASTTSAVVTAITQIVLMNAIIDWLAALIEI